MPTISQIAKLAGVSSATVSRVFSGHGYVSEENKTQILAIADELNYTPKQYKKRQVAGHSNTIGVVVPDIHNPYYTEIIKGIEEVTFPNGYDLFICDTDEDFRKEIRCLSALRHKQVGGLISAPVSDMVEYNADYLREMNDAGIPVVLVDRDIKYGGLDGVFLDNYLGAYRAIQCFIENGHRDIAMICGPTSSKTGLERLNGYLQALRENSIPIQEDFILYGDFKAQSAYYLTKKLIQSRKKVTAILASNNSMASGCLQALTEHKIRIPQDIAFISYGRLERFESQGLKFSSVTQPIHPIGVECAKILLEKMRSGKKYKRMPSKRIILETKLVLWGTEKYPTESLNIVRV